MRIKMESRVDDRTTNLATHETTIPQPQNEAIAHELSTHDPAFPPTVSAPAQDQSSPGPEPPPPYTATYPDSNQPPSHLPETTPYTTEEPKPNTTHAMPSYAALYQNPYLPQNPAEPRNSAVYPSPQRSVYPPAEIIPPPRYSDVVSDDTNYGYQHDQQTHNSLPAQPIFQPPTQQLENNQQPAAPANITIVRTGQRNTGPPPNNYMGLAICSIFCCCIFGFVAVADAAQVNSLWRRGRYNSARRAANRAKWFAILAIVLGLIISVANAVLRVMLY